MRRMSFKECTEKGRLLELGESDKDKVEELLKMVEHREKFWESIKEQSKDYPSLFLEGYYEIVKELATAILTLNGWKALNHECLFAYLRKKEDLEIDFDYLLELKDTRNSIDYRGVMVGYDLWKNNMLKIKVMITGLKEYLGRD